MKNRLFLLLFAFSTLFAGQAAATTYELCEKTEIEMISTALIGAGEIALRAAGHVRDNEDYATWFGVYSRTNSQIVRDNLKAINRALLDDAMVARCPNLGESGCERDTYANVFPNRAYVVNLCPNFFTQPVMHSFPPGHYELENGTREGTIIHEMSHFNAVAGTDDNCYSRTDCSSMANRSTMDAINNADSYQYFAEDVTYNYVPEDFSSQTAAHGSTDVTEPQSATSAANEPLGHGHCRACRQRR